MRHIEELIGRQVHRWNSIAQALKIGCEQEGESSPQAVAAAEATGRLHPVICFSRDLGSGARVVSRCICDRLNYHIYGTDTLDAVANDMQVQRELISALDEHGQNQLEMMVMTFMAGREIDRHEYLTSLTRVMKSMAMKGGVVLLGRGAPFIVGSQAALNVMVTAPLDTRVKRLTQYDPELNETSARKKILEHDQRRNRFIHHCFHIDAHCPECYDLAINTGNIDPENAAEIVFAALEAKGYDLEKMKITV